MYIQNAYSMHITVHNPNAIIVHNLNTYHNPFSNAYSNVYSSFISYCLIFCAKISLQILTYGFRLSCFRIRTINRIHRMRLYLENSLR